MAPGPEHMAFLVELVISVVFAFMRRGGSKRQGVLLLGCCDAGKTLLFSRVCMLYLVAHHTV